MANEHGYFWDSVNGDRLYSASSFEEWLKKFFRTGVFQDECQVESTGGMTVKVNTGYANVDGKVKFFDTATSFTLSPANGTYPRIDTVVIERDNTNRTISVKVVTGNYSGNAPQPTAPVRDALVYQIVLAQIYISAGVTEINQANITDTRPDDNLCGWVVGTVDRIDLAQIMEQSEEEFTAWFESIRGQLDEDAAGHLQNEIDEINTQIDSVVDDMQQTLDNYTANVLESTTITFTIRSSDWNNNSYTIYNTKITADSNQEWMLDTNATLAQVKAWGKAAIVDGGQQVGSAIILSRGTIPTIDIPVKVILRGVK